MNSENIFDIWRFLGKGTPFVVRRNGWYHLSYMVTRVKPKGHYGEAYGYRLTDGKPENGITEEQVIDCCGCGNWEILAYRHSCHMATGCYLPRMTVCFRPNMKKTIC